MLPSPQKGGCYWTNQNAAKCSAPNISTEKSPIIQTYPSLQNDGPVENEDKRSLGSYLYGRLMRRHIVTPINFRLLNHIIVNGQNQPQSRKCP